MAIKLNIGEKTTRTHPRIMKQIGADVIIFATERGAMWLNGESAGQYMSADRVAWEHFDDVVGSITIHNAD